VTAPQWTLSKVEDLQGVVDGVQQQFDQADYTETLNGIATFLEEQHAEYFSGDHSPSGDAWPALSPYTVARKGHDTILEESNALEESLTGQTPDSIREVVSDGSQHGLSFGTSDEKSIFHQEGTSRIPQREHVGTNEEQVDHMAEQVADAAVQALLS